MAVRIYQKTKHSMQQGCANGQGWLLEHNVPYACRADPLTGWQGSGNTLGEVSISFPTREAAIRFAEEQGLSYTVWETPPSPRIMPQSYAANFQGNDDVEYGED